MIVCRLEMVRSIVEGKKVKVDRIVKILREFAHAAHPMDPQLVSQLEARFGSQATSSPAHELIEVQSNSLSAVESIKPLIQPESTNA